MTPDELDKIGSESALVALCVGPDEPPWDRCEDVATTALCWLAEHAESPALLFTSGAWAAQSFLGFQDEFGLPDQMLARFTARSPWLALLKLVAAVQLLKRGELKL